MHIEKLPSGSTRVRVSTGQKNAKGRYIYVTFTDPDEKRAIRMAAEYEDEHRDKSQTTGTFASALESYITQSSKRLSPATVREYRSRQNTLLNRYPEFCQLQLSQITRKAMQAVVNDMAADYSPKSVSNFIGLISAVMTSQDYRPPIIKRPEPVQPDIFVPEVEQVQQMAKLAEGTDYEIPILLAAYGTLRCGEICALTLDDIEGDTIHVRRDMVMGENRQWHIKPPKKRQSDRYIVLPHWIIQKLSQGFQKRTEAPIVCDTGKSIPLDRFVSPFAPSCLSNSFTRWAERHGMHVTIHGLRHFAATDMSDAGIPEAYILARGGWATDHVMKSRYRTTLQKTKDEVNTKLLERYSDHDINP